MTTPLAALAFASALAAAQPGGARLGDASVSSGVALFHQGDYEACIEVLTASVEGAPEDVSLAQAHLFLGLAHAVLGQWSSARTAFAEALRADPEIAPDPERIPPSIVGVFEQVRQGVRGVLEVRATEPSEVYVDGQRRGETPFSGEVPVGRHEVRVTSQDGLREAVHDALVAAGRPTRVEATLAAKPGSITLRSHPTGAEVFLGDRALGRTPLESVSLPSGDTTLTVRLRGYEDAVVPVRVRPTAPVDLDVDLEVAESSRLGPPPMFGLDRREGTEAWTVDFALLLGGGAPVSSNLQPDGAPTTAVRGGAAIGFELGIGLFDLVEVVGSIAPETGGIRLAHFARLAPTAGPTIFELDDGVSGALSVLQVRLGLLTRVTVVRLGSWRPYVGLGWSYSTPMGSVQHLGLPSSEGASDAYAITTRLSATSWSPLLGLKVTLGERSRRDDYFALDAFAEVRVDATQWSADLAVTAPNGRGAARGAAAAAAVRATFDEPSGGDTIGTQFLLGLAFRL